MAWLGLERTLKTQPDPTPALGRDATHYIRLTRAHSNLALKTSRSFFPIMMAKITRTATTKIVTN